MNTYFYEAFEGVKLPETGSTASTERAIGLNSLSAGGSGLGLGGGAGGRVMEMRAGGRQSGTVQQTGRPCASPAGRRPETAGFKLRQPARRRYCPGNMAMPGDGRLPLPAPGFPPKEKAAVPVQCRTGTAAFRVSKSIGRKGRCGGGTIRVPHSASSEADQSRLQAAESGGNHPVFPTFVFSLSEQSRMRNCSDKLSSRSCPTPDRNGCFLTCVGHPRNACGLIASHRSGCSIGCPQAAACRSCGRHRGPAAFSLQRGCRRDSPPGRGCAPAAGFARQAGPAGAAA